MEKAEHKNKKVKTDGSSVKDKKSKNKTIGWWIEMIFELVLPFSICLWAFFWVAQKWGLGRPGSFGYILSWSVVVMIGGMSLSTLFGWIRRKYQKLGKSHRIEYREKRKGGLLRIIFWRIILPFFICLVVALLPVSGETVLTKLANYIATIGEYRFVQKIGYTVIQSEDLDTKTKGIETLKAIHSQGCLIELVKILEEDTDTLGESEFYREMKYALSSFESKAKSKLLEIISKEDEKLMGDILKHKSDLHRRYFKSVFEKLVRDANDYIPIGDKKINSLIRLEEIELNLKTDLRDIELSTPEISGSDTILDFILDVFLQMKKLKSDKRIYNLTRRIASDVSYNDRTRSRALRVIAKLGNKDDFSVIIPYLGHKNEVIKQGALVAIRTLHLKLRGKEEEDIY